MIRLLSLMFLLLFPSLSLADLSTPPNFVVTWILDDIHRAWMDDYQTDTAVDVVTRSVDTPIMDAIANNGVRFNNFRSHAVCSPARVMFFGYGDIRRSTNLQGRAIVISDPAASWATTAPVIQPEGDNLVRRLQAQGYEVAFFGKMHMGQLQSYHPLNTPFAERMGFDYFDVVIPANVGKMHHCTGTNPDIALCAGHNWFCAHDSSGDYSIYGSGSSTDDGNNEFSSKAIIDAANAFIDTKVTAGEKWWVFISVNAPHAPWDFAASGMTCDYPLGSGQTDDRVPGSSAITATEVYDEMIEDLDTRMGVTHELLDLASGGLNHMVIIVGDNGSPLARSSPECVASRGAKGTTFPCGVQVPLAFSGDNINNEDATTEITGLMYAPDFPKTLIDIAAGGSGVSGSIDGISFASCLALPDPSDCTVSHDVICWQKFKEPGGSDGTLQRVPMVSTDVANEWTIIEYSCSTLLHSGDYLLHRRYRTNADPPYDFCEEFYDRNLNRYLVSTDTLGGSFLADNRTVGASLGCVAGVSDDPDGADVSGLSTAQQLAFAVVSDALNGMLDQDGYEEATHSGGGF